ncbi:hypothetical protein EN780_03215 [Mesorhizobium sp. M4B.F.Ca.ET.089.01.1.1]|uniref:hypothetical protein n=1 Tax=Mesorhizobium sp. M4B.F.Ca.ET.089.01.1.1 TaxID=2496662 RepID=UPI000FE3B388|nr:hypothetical protein [Mesorhizobium sp. M4B.F.Ca.ET.089.01.1.1]RWX70417.1 hypothetical protein EN780_03215 [Mesorhizobium sp. M4B.F.Ca.ET.089.01.1.1]
MQKYRQKPLDDYSNSPGMPLKEALFNAVGDTVGMAHVFAVRLMIERLAEAGILKTEDLIDILNYGRGWGPTRKDYEWEVVEPEIDVRSLQILTDAGVISTDEDLLV